MMVGQAKRTRRGMLASVPLVFLTLAVAGITLGLLASGSAQKLGLEPFSSSSSAGAAADSPGADEATRTSEEGSPVIEKVSATAAPSAVSRIAAGEVGSEGATPSAYRVGSGFSASLPASTLGSADVLGAGSRLARGLVPLHVLALPESSTGALVIGAEDNHMMRVRCDSLRSTSVTGEVYVAIGKSGARKQREGDEKTPIGVYWVRDFIPGERLPEIYGEGAYPISYPNLWDRRVGRTGSGIWIHGTNKSDDELLPRSSRGCLTLRNQDFLALDAMVVVDHTPVVITERIEWVPRGEYERTRDGLLAAVERWQQDWESLDTERYLSHYAEDFQAEGMDLQRWSAHKRRVNAVKKRIEIELDELSAFNYPDESDVYLVTFRQEYRSDNFNSTRYKSQYWKSTAEGWRIVQEGGI